MRTTITLDDDVAAAVDERMRRDHVGRSEAVNGLIRGGLRPARSKAPYVHRTRSLGAVIDISNVAEALELIEEWDREVPDGRVGAG